MKYQRTDAGGGGNGYNQAIAVSEIVRSSLAPSDSRAKIQGEIPWIHCFTYLVKYESNDTLQRVHKIDCESQFVIHVSYHVHIVLVTGDGVRVRLMVPKLVRAGSAATLVCQYDLSDKPLYAVKWYRGNYEFFRYVPQATPPMVSFSTRGLHVDVSCCFFFTYKIQVHRIQIVYMNFNISVLWFQRPSGDTPGCSRLNQRHRFLRGLDWRHIQHSFWFCISQCHRWES